MKALSSFQGVFLHREPVDGRKAINGLSEIVEQARMGELTGSNLFVFCGKRRDVIKILYFDKSGFAAETIGTRSVSMAEKARRYSGHAHARADAVVTRWL